MIQVKCPTCLENMDAGRLVPILNWNQGWTEVKCVFCRNEFKVATEIEPQISSDFDLVTFINNFGLEKFPDGVNKEKFHEAMMCIAKDNQVKLKNGFDDPETKASYEFAMIHHQRVKRTLMPQDRKKVS